MGPASSPGLRNPVSVDIQTAVYRWTFVADIYSSKLLVVEFVHFLLHIICVFSSTVVSKLFEFEPYSAEYWC